MPGVPANTELPSITGTPQDGQTLTADPGSWTNAASYSAIEVGCGPCGANRQPQPRGRAPVEALRCARIVLREQPPLPTSYEPSCRRARIFGPWAPTSQPTSRAHPLGRARRLTAFRKARSVPASSGNDHGHGASTGRGRVRWPERVFGLLGVLVSVAAATFAALQVHVASEQNAAAEQQSLVALVTDVAQELTVVDTHGGALKAGVGNELQAEAAQGLTTVRALHDRSVPAVDNYEFGVAFQITGENADALRSYALAAKGYDPRYRSAALLGEAQILDELGGAYGDEHARDDINRALTAYAGEPDISQQTRDSNMAFVGLREVELGLLDCADARGKLRTAQAIIAGDPSSNSASVAHAERTVKQELGKCPSTAAGPLHTGRSPATARTTTQQ